MEIILNVSDKIAEKFNNLDECKKESFAKLIEVFLEEIDDKKE